MIEVPQYEHLPTIAAALEWSRRNREQVLEWLVQEGAPFHTSGSDETVLRITSARPFDLVVGSQQGPRPVLLGDMVVHGVGGWYPIGPKAWRASYKPRSE